eukprot:2154291-Amphidinium_carterae.1
MYSYSKASLLNLDIIRHGFSSRSAKVFLPVCVDTGSTDALRPRSAKEKGTTNRTKYTTFRRDTGSCPIPPVACNSQAM